MDGFRGTASNSQARNSTANQFVAPPTPLRIASKTQTLDTVDYRAGQSNTSQNLERLQHRRPFREPSRRPHLHRKPPKLWKKADPLPRRQNSVTTKNEASQPVPQPSRPAKPPTLNPYWPEVRAAIMANLAGSVVGFSKEKTRPSVCTCLICNEAELVINGIQDRRSDEELARTGIIQEDGVMAACGHIFGRQCLDAWEELCSKSSRSFTCPACRFDLDPRRCPKHRLEAPVTDLAVGTRKFGLIFDNLQATGHANKAAADQCWDCQMHGMTNRERT